MPAQNLLICVAADPQSTRSLGEQNGGSARAYDVLGQSRSVRPVRRQQNSDRRFGSLDKARRPLRGRAQIMALCMANSARSGDLLRSCAMAVGVAVELAAGDG